MHGQRDDPFRQPVGDREGPVASAKGGKHLLAMGGYGIIDHRRNIFSCQELIQPVAVDPFEDKRILVKDVMAVRRTVWRRDLRVSFEGIVIEISSTASGGDIGVQAFQLHIQYGSLYGIQPAVTAYQIVIITSALPVICNHFEPAC